MKLKPRAIEVADTLVVSGYFAISAAKFTPKF